jgi:flagellar biosynthesis/type III secretory pathway protein FliH
MSTQIGTGNTVATNGNSTLRYSDAAGLDAHAQTITGIGSLVKQGNQMLEIVEGQMRAADMGAEVTSELATLRDLGTAYIAQAIKARAKLEEVNRHVQEAYEASRGQAADKGYQLGGR